MTKVYVQVGVRYSFAPDSLGVPVKYKARSADGSIHVDRTIYVKGGREQAEKLIEYWNRSTGWRYTLLDEDAPVENRPTAACLPTDPVPASKEKAGETTKGNTFVGTVCPGCNRVVHLADILCIWYSDNATWTGCRECFRELLVAAGKIEDPKPLKQRVERWKAMESLRGDDPWGFLKEE